MSPLWCSHWEVENNRDSGLENTREIFTLFLNCSVGAQSVDLMLHWCRTSLYFLKVVLFFRLVSLVSAGFSFSIFDVLNAGLVCATYVIS